AARPARRILMKRLVVGVPLFLILVPILAAEASQAGPEVDRKAFIEKYCSSCHNDRVRAGSFSWNEVRLDEPGVDAEKLEKVIRQMRAGTMPPPGAPRPDAEETQRFTAALEGMVDRGARDNPYAGAPALHRLNLTEYRNAVRDLLDLDIDVSTLLPPDSP